MPFAIPSFVSNLLGYKNKSEDSSDSMEEHRGAVPDTPSSPIPEMSEQDILEDEVTESDVMEVDTTEVDEDDILYGDEIPDSAQSPPPEDNMVTVLSDAEDTVVTSGTPEIDSYIEEIDDWDVGKKKMPRIMSRSISTSTSSSGHSAGDRENTSSNSNDQYDKDSYTDMQNDDDDSGAIVEITRRRMSQDREGNCYCGKDRNLNIAELLCASCARWYHESCIGYQLGKLLPFMTNYVFICKNCSPTGLESFKRNQAQCNQMCVAVLANLIQASYKDGSNRISFSKDKEIIPFFEMHYDALTTRRMAQSVQSMVTKTLLKESNYFVPHDCKDGDLRFGLIHHDLTQIRPNYDAMIRVGALKVTELGMQGSSAAMKGRGAKRRTVDGGAASQASLAKKLRGDTLLPKLIAGHGYPTDHPFNKDGYRYVLAEPDSNAPFRQEFDESSDWAGKLIPGWLYRVLNPGSVLFALHDRAPQLKVSDDRLSVTGDKGYCMIRANLGSTVGNWYFEAKITDLPEGAATRIGFSQMYGNLQGPLGYDKYGYSWRSRFGTVFHQAIGKSYAKGGYGLDDVLGFLIILPQPPKEVSLVPPSYKDKPLVRFKSHLYYEDKELTPELIETDRREGSKIICFKNGVCHGVAFENLYEGTYYPSVSIYRGATVEANFGPNFWMPPKDYEFQGMNERAQTATVDQTMSDLMFLTDNHGKLTLDTTVPMLL